MKYNNLLSHLLLLLLLLLESSYSKVINKNNNSKSIYMKDGSFTSPNNNKTIIYNFYCLNGYDEDTCSIIEYNVDIVVNYLPNIDHEYLKNAVFPSSVKIDFIVDDFSKLETKIDDSFIMLNTEFKPLKDSEKEKFDFDIYPNYQTINEKIYNNKIREDLNFIIVLDSLNNHKEIANSLNLIYELYIIKDIINYFMDEANVNKELKLYINNFIDESIMIPQKSEQKYNNTLLYRNENYIMKNNNKKNKPNDRIIAVGDIHGDYEKLIKVLRHAKLIDKNNNWIGKNSILVQVGDLIDRGKDPKKVLDLMIKLKNQATKFGGVVNILLGNHELLNLQGDFRYTYISDIMKIGDIHKYRKEYSLNTKYGKLLRKEMEPIIVIDDILFVHAGLKKKFLDRDIDSINREVHDILKKAPYDVNISSNHAINTNDIFDGEEGILWTRYFSKFPEEKEKEVCEELSEVLKITNTTHMVVGHTVQENGKINTFCDNKIIMIDIGLTELIGGYFGYLEIKRDTKEIWAIYN